MFGRKFPEQIQDISLKCPGHFRKKSRMFPRNVREIAGKCPGKLQDISGRCPSNFWDIYGTFPEHVPDISGTCPGNFREMFGNFPGHFPDISGTLPGNFWEIYGKFPAKFPEISTGMVIEGPSVQKMILWHDNCKVLDTTFIHEMRDEFYDHTGILDTGFTCWISKEWEIESKSSSFPHPFNRRK